MTEMRWSQRMSLKHLAMAMLDSLAIRVVHTVAEGVVTTAGGSELRTGRCGSGSWFSLLPSPALASIFSAVPCPILVLVSLLNNTNSNPGEFDRSGSK